MDSLIGSGVVSLFCRVVDEPDTFLPVQLLDPDPHFFTGKGRHLSSHEIGFDRELAMSSVHDDQEMHGCRTSKIRQCIQTCPDCATGVSERMTPVSWAVAKPTPMP